MAHRHLWVSWASDAKSEGTLGCAMGRIAELLALKLQDDATLPANDVTSEIADVMAGAVRAYGVDDAAVLMIVQPGERNSYDQQAKLHGFLM